MLHVDEIAWINANFRIVLMKKPRGVLIGAGSLKHHIDEKRLNSLYEQLQNLKADSYTYWNRKSLKIRFYSK